MNRDLHETPGLQPGATKPRAMKLKILLGDYPNTRALRHGKIASPRLELDFADAKTPNRFFKRVVRDLEFDVAELAIVTYLTARAHGKPLVLLPAVVRAKFQHDSLVCAADRPLAPPDLPGKRVGIRSHSVTTVAWVRGIVQNDYGVDLGKVHWVTFEDAHVAEVRDPPGYERAAAGKDPLAMLLAGELDAAVLTGDALKDPRVRPVIADPAAAAREWHAKWQAVPINHMVVARADVLAAHPWIAGEVFRLLVAAEAKSGSASRYAFGVEASRKSLELITRYAAQQGLTGRQYSVDELFDDTTRALAPS
jgi:4,5-dihydroxyphthalate decarboxylase